MKYLQIACLAVAVTAMLAGSASATSLTSPAGTAYTGEVKLASEGGIKVKNEVGFGEVTCAWNIKGIVESHGSSITAGGKVSEITMTECVPAVSISVLRTGKLEFHTDGEAVDGNGTFTWNEFELTFNYKALGISCVYATGTGLNLGTVTGSKTTGTNATIDGSSPKVPRTGDSALCGATATVTGNFKVTTPTYLDVD